MKVKLNGDKLLQQKFLLEFLNLTNELLEVKFKIINFIKFVLVVLSKISIFNEFTSSIKFIIYFCHLLP